MLNNSILPFFIFQHAYIHSDKNFSRKCLKCIRHGQTRNEFISRVPHSSLCSIRFKVRVQPVSPLKTGESTQTNKNKCSVSNCAVRKKWELEIRSSGENPGEPGATTAWSVRSGWWFKEQARTRSICFATLSWVIFPFPWTWPRWSNPELLRIESKRQKSKYPRIWFIGLSRIRNYVKNLRSIQSSILNYCASHRLESLDSVCLLSKPAIVAIVAGFKSKHTESRLSSRWDA